MPTPLDRFTADVRHSEGVRALAARGDVRRYRKGSILIQEGDTGDTMYILLDGRVKVYCTEEGGREIMFGLFGAGEYFGEMALDGGPRSASVATLEDCVCSVVTRARLLAFISERPEFALELLAQVIRRLRLATRDARNLAFIDVYGRLSQCLQDLAEPRPDGTRRIPARLTHQDLASRVGCSREMVSRILKDLESGGHVRLEDRHIVLVGRLPRRW
ncbi:MAG: cyclic nucleotide-binding domain-containing protein [Rhodoferax sp.]